MPPQPNSTNPRTADQAEREVNQPTAESVESVEDRSLVPGYRENYAARFTGVTTPGVGVVTFTGENEFDNRETFDRVTATWSSARDMIDPFTGRRTSVRWGAGIPLPRTESGDDVPVYRLGPNGERILVSGEERAGIEAGSVQYPSVYGAALDANNPGSISSIWAADITGQVVTDGNGEYDTKFVQQKQKQLDELVTRWTTENNGAIPDAHQMAILDQIAEQNTMKAIAFVIGGNPDNLPKTVAPQGAEAIYLPGQILPDFIGGSQPRAVTESEAQALNWIMGSASVDDSQRDVLMKLLFSPQVSTEEKQSIISEVTGQIQYQAANAQSVEDGFDWTWNPAALLVEVFSNFVLKPIDVIYSDYVDPSLTYSLSALPGGPRTATWEEAQSIAPGQMYAQAAGKLTNVFNFPAKVGISYETGGWGTATLTAFKQLINPLAGFTDPAVDLINGRSWDEALLLGGTNIRLQDPDDLEDLAPFAYVDSDSIYDAQYRQETFVDNPFGSGISGGTGFGTSLIWDPLIILGPIGKGLRVGHRLGMGAGAIRGTDDVRKVRDQLTLGRDAFSDYETARTALNAARRAGDDAAVARWTDEVARLRTEKDAAMAKQAPIAKFIDWLLDPAEGTRRTFQEIESHKVINKNGALVEALSYARTYDDAALILRASIMDMDAIRALRNVNFDAYREIQTMIMRVSIDNLMAAPEKLVQLERKVGKEVEDALSEVKRLEDEAMSVDTGWQKRMTQWQNATPAQRRALATPEELAGSPERLKRILMDEGNARIDRLNARLAEARAGNAPQAVLDDIWRQLDEAQDLANQGLFGPAMPREFVERARQAHERLAVALERENMVWTARTNGIARTPEQIKDAAETLNSLYNSNVRYKASLDAAGAFMGSDRFFGRGNLQGLARLRESSFQRQAQRKGFQKSTHRTGFKWVAEHFKAPGGHNVTVWSAAKGLGSLTQDAVTRPFTYAIMESPAGYIRTDGVGGMDNYREVQATVNNLKSISPEMRDSIIERFQRKMILNNDGGEAAVRSLEQDILREIAKRYIDDISDVDDVKDFMKQIEDMYKFFDEERASKIKMIRENGFWVDEDGVLNKSPFLESQLLNGTPMMDFRRLESLVGRFAKNYRKAGKRAAEGKTDGRGKASEIADAKAGIDARTDQALTRLAQEEEILVRAKESGDVERIADARIGVEKSEKNVKKLKKEMDDFLSQNARSGLSNGTPRRVYEKGLSWYDQFQSLWRFGVLFRVGYPVRNSIEGLARRVAYDASIMPVLQDAARGTQNIASNVAQGRGRTRTAKMKQRKADKALRQLQETGQVTRGVARWAEREGQRIRGFRDNQVQFRDTLRAAYDDLTAQREFVTDAASRAELDRDLLEIAESLAVFDNVLKDLDTKLLPFGDNPDPVDLIAAYRQSLDRPRKVGDEFIHGVDGRQYWGMRGDPNMGPIMEMNASARETVQATLALRLSATRATVNASILSLGGEVLPSAANYWTEVTRVANQQVRNSVVGQGWLRGESAETIARRIMGSDPRAVQFRDIRNIENYEDAFDAAETALRELDRYYPNPEVRAALARDQVTEDVMKGLLDTDDFRGLLVPVHGAVIGPAVGSKGATTGLMDRINGFTNKAFEIIGTLPEDQLIRMPFASRIYESSLQQSLRLLSTQFGDAIPAWAVDIAISASRKRAIKDTKEFLFTQDRRTNFGRVGERFIPFVSAYQNSVVAYGKLIARSPEVLYFAEQAWRTPDRIGVTDADGNLRIPIPSFLVGKKWITGTYDDEWVYDKSSVFVLTQNVDPVMTFRAGPAIQMAASELFRQNWVTPAAPSMLRGIFGEENAQKLWDTAVIATFGVDDQGRPNTFSTLPFGADKALPPSIQKGVQVLQSSFGQSPQNSTVYSTYYVNNARQMMLEFWNGERDNMPTKEEVAERTNSQFLFRGLAGNLLGLSGPLGPITPARPTNDIWELANVYYEFQDMYGIDADQHFIELFGDEIAFVAKMRGTASLAGAPSNKRTLIRAEENAELIEAVAPNLIDTRMLGYMLSDGSYQASAGDEGRQIETLYGLLPGQETDSLDRFDPNVRLTQLLSDIPGTSLPWSKRLTPEEGTKRASIDIGWDAYLKGSEAIYAELEAQGISSLQSSAAKGLREQRRELVERLGQDPMYVAWYEDYVGGFEDRTRSALTFIRSVTENKDFMDREGAVATDMWQTAKYWLNERRKYASDARANKDEPDYLSGLKDAWAERSAMISMANPRFREFWTRYLDNDDLNVL